MKRISKAQLKQRSNAGKIGGKAKVPKGFALMSLEKRTEAARRGGLSKRKVRVDLESNSPV